jgi:hypothetical protein
MSPTKATRIVPGMTRAEFCLTNVDLRKRWFYVRIGRQNELKSKPPRHIAVFRGYLVNRGNDFVCIALNAGHPLGHKATVDSPDWPCVNAVVRTFS